jgi:3-oxoacyl-[acyl-carrier-protein] synthase III
MIGNHSPCQEPAMNEEALNASLRKFLKTVGVTSQREIEMAVRTAVKEGRIKGNEVLPAQMVLTIAGVGMNYKIDGTIELV